MFDKKELCNFLVEAKRATYAAGDSVAKTVNIDQSTTLGYRDGDWEYHDNYFGGEPYGGREVVFYKNKPVYMMVYYGEVADSLSDVKEVYGTLMGALKEIPADNPYRGPEYHCDGKFLYANEFTGEIDNFHGRENIFKNGEEIYSAKYIGGFVDIRKE